MTGSWMKMCDGAMYFISGNFPKNNAEASFPSVQITNKSSWSNSVEALTYISNHFLGEFDWFITASEDTHADIEKLRDFLLEFDKFDPHFFGYAWSGLLKTGHDGGYILSRPSLDWLVKEALQNQSLCSEKYSGSERIRSCLQHMGIYSGIDARVHGAFQPRNSFLNSSSWKTILAWNTLLNRDIALLAADHSQNCPVKCHLYSDKSYLDQADAVTFFVHPQDAGTLPTVRHPWQRYVFFNIESYATGEQLPKLPSLHNWSMTYQRDSDVRLDYYGQLLRHTQSAEEAKFVDQTARKKTKMIAWLVSNCHPPSQREKYVHKLHQFISIDQFGGCPGSAKIPYSCPRNPKYYGYWCDSIPFTTDYRFYIAFENAVCRDYVTEKFFQALDRLMVPIVLRKADYLDIAPPNSYIAADQFASAKELANYLHYLANNIDEYLKYFDYRKTIKVAWHEEEMLADAYCRLCRMLHENRTSGEGSDMRIGWQKNTACVPGFANDIKSKQ
uniref:Fucosyltransferase n=1 Tax=Plectus sambesii TaxID=2011161 RepID=A0A914X4F6_9BILA